MDRSLTVWHRLLEHADLSVTIEKLLHLVVNIRANVYQVSPASSPDDIPEDDPIEDGPGSQSSVHLEEDNHEQQKPRRLHLKRHIDDRGNGRGILVHGSMFLCPKPTSSGSGRPPSQSPVDDGFDSIERQLSSRKRSGSKVRIVSLRYSKALDISDKPAQPVEWYSCRYSCHSSVALAKANQGKQLAP